MAAIVFAAIAGGILNRLRGGWFSNISRSLGWEWGGKQRTQTMRLIWAIPTAALVYFLGDYPWGLLPALVVTFFASMALLGHGAHMIFDNERFIRESKNKTELTTRWLPFVFGGLPDETWPDNKVTLYNLIGMGFIGLLRNTIAMLPLLILHPSPWVFIYAASGILHGGLYWIGNKVNGTAEMGEVAVGSFTWASLVVLIKEVA